MMNVTVDDQPQSNVNNLQQFKSSVGNNRNNSLLLIPPIQEFASSSKHGNTNNDDSNNNDTSCLCYCIGLKREFLSTYAAISTLCQHLWTIETFTCLFVSLSSTLFFCFYEFGPEEYFMSRLDFTFLGTGLVFPITFLVNETFRRRELALQRLAHVKALTCQIQIALLMWRAVPSSATSPPPTITTNNEEWKNNVANTLHNVVQSMMAILQLPKWTANRHMYTKQGRSFRMVVVNKLRDLSRDVITHITTLHQYTEQLKQWTILTPSECTRVNQYIYLLQTEFESLLMLKTYRTTNIARSFVRVMVLILPIFYGPYFAWVARSPPPPENTNDIGVVNYVGVVFAVSLSLITTLVLQGLVKVQRALEDPFLSVRGFVGEVIDLLNEMDDTLDRLNVIREIDRNSNNNTGGN
jgi:hypothetical protein